MLRGLPASIVLHAAVISAGYIVLPGLSRPTQVSVEIVPIELVDVSELTNIAPRVQREEPEEVEEPPRLEDYLDDVDSISEDAIVEEDMLAPAEIVPEADVSDTVIIPDDPVETPEPEPEPDEPEPEPDRPLLEQQPEDDPLDSILGDASNLFDRTPRDQSKSPPPPPSDDTSNLEDEQPGAAEDRRGAGEQTGNTAAITAMIQAQMRDCWDDVEDLPNPERLNVILEIELNRDGTLKRDVRLVDPARPPIGDRVMGVAIERALRAARRCAPYRIPEQAQDYYEEWDVTTLRVGRGLRD